MVQDTFIAYHTSKDVPEEAVPQIQKQIEAAQETNDTIFQCTVKEAFDCLGKEMYGVSELWRK